VKASRLKKNGFARHLGSFLFFPISSSPIFPLHTPLLAAIILAMKTQTKPQIEISRAGTDPQMSAYCPSCGKYVGAYGVCPYCQASMSTRVSLKLLKVIAVFGGIFGLLLLWIGIHYKEIPRVMIQSIDLQYNMAVIRLEGIVTSVKLDEPKNSFRLTLDDGTGQVTVFSPGKLNQFRKEMKDKFPQAGDKISTVGNLSISESYGITQFVTTTRRYSLLSRSSASEGKFSELNPGTEGKSFIFTAKITEVKSFPKGKNLKLNDGTGDMSLAVFDAEVSQAPESVVKALSQPGATLRVTARVEMYHEQMQLRLLNPDNPANLQVVDSPAPSTESGSGSS
jgi:DNA/RNA endonuclease YhcR with UshA esterase domain